MSITHKFIRKQFTVGFQTENAILSTTPYKPEVLFIGTFNPETPNTNFADFFYGRNLLWPAFKRMIEPNYVFQNQRRMPANGIPQFPLDPTLPEILEMCNYLKLTFSDLIVETLHNHDEEIHFLPNDNIILNGQEFNLIQDNAGNGVFGLANLDAIGQVNWNTQNIVDYLINAPSIKHIYLTRRPVGLWGNQWNLIANHPELQDRVFANILSPSGVGFANLNADYIPNQNQNSRLNSLIHYWIWNGVDNPQMENINNPNFGHLDHQWLADHGVDVNLF